MTNLERLLERIKPNDLGIPWKQAEAYCKLRHIFVMHGPALVEALEELLKSVQTFSKDHGASTVDAGRMLKAIQILTRIEREVGDESGGV